MLAENVFKSAQTKWAAPIFFAPRKDGLLRFYGDHRKFKSVTLIDSYPLPRMIECLVALRENTVFFNFDANSGYWRTEMEEADQEKTDFIPRHGPYRLTGMFSGLKKGQVEFRQTMDVILSPIKWQHDVVCLDDVAVFSHSTTRHIEPVPSLLTLLR